MAPDPLTPAQARLMDYLLSGGLDADADLRKQAAAMRSRGQSCDCGCDSFYVDVDRRTPPTQADASGPAAEANGRDPGGNLVGVLLWVREGYLSEVEIFGYESSEFSGLPEPSELRFSEWSDPDENGARRLLNP